MGVLRTRGFLLPPWQPLMIPFATTPLGQLYQSPPSPISGDKSGLEQRGLTVPVPPLPVVFIFDSAAIAVKGAESPGSGCMRVLCALVPFFPSEDVEDKLHSPARPYESQTTARNCCRCDFRVHFVVHSMSTNSWCPVFPQTLESSDNLCVVSSWKP